MSATTVLILLYFTPHYTTPHLILASYVTFRHIKLGHITFYDRNVTTLGQTPLSSTDDVYDAYSLHGKKLLGSCGFPLVYNKGVYPMNWTHIADPTSSPTYSPTASPTTTSAPTHTPTIPPTPSPTEPLPFVGNFSCLGTCEYYPGPPVSGADMGLCTFFTVYMFYLCSTFSMMHGLCKIPECASTCTAEDYCYFAVNTATSCPSQGTVVLACALIFL